MRSNALATGPLNHRHRSAGARLEVVAGWEVAVHYPGQEGAGPNRILDCSHRSVQEINGSDTGEQLASVCGAEVQVRAIHSAAGLDAYRLTRSRAVLFGSASASQAVDVTGGWASLALSGPDARSILNKVSALDLRDTTLPVGGCCQGPVFGVNVLFGHFADRYELHSCPDMLEFLWDVVCDAGREFGLHPVGWSEE